MSFERQAEPALAADDGAADLEQEITAAAGRSYCRSLFMRRRATKLDPVKF